MPSILIPGKNKQTNPSRLTLPPTKTVKSDSSAPYTIENYIPVHFNSMILIRPFVISDAKISSLPLKSLTLIFNNHIYSPHIPSHSQVKWKTSLLMAKNHTFFLLIVIKDFVCLFVCLIQLIRKYNLEKKRQKHLELKNTSSFLFSRLHLSSKISLPFSLAVCRSSSVLAFNSEFSQVFWLCSSSFSCSNLFSRY